MAEPVDGADELPSVEILGRDDGDNEMRVLRRGDTVYFHADDVVRAIGTAASKYDDRPETAFLGDVLRILARDLEILCEEARRYRSERPAGEDAADQV